MNVAASDSLKKFTIYDSQIQLTRPVLAGTYCESVGRQSSILGVENGVFEVWVYPMKILSDLTFSVHIPQYHVTVPAAKMARRIMVRPEITTIMYSHDLFTIQQHLLAPLDSPGVVILFDVDAFVPLEIWVSFLPNLAPMWPAGLGGQYSLWDEKLPAYYFGEGSRTYAGVFGSPLAERLSETPGHQLPDSPMQFVLRPSLAEMKENFFPLIVAGSVEGRDRAVQFYIDIKNSIPELYREHREFYEDFLTRTTRVTTPSQVLDRAFDWAKVSLTKGLVNNPQLGEGMVAGYGVSGKTHRPGFAWYFGGDAFLNSLAMNRVGDLEGIRKSLALWRKHQREDGKIFHELTQSAAFIRWFEDYPYGFYHAETTAYYILAMYDYFALTNDDPLLIESWESIKKAYRFCVRADEDSDGLMENSAAGLAAMEVGEMLKKNRVDVYLASLWLRALQCMRELANYFEETELVAEAADLFERGMKSFRSYFIDEKEKRLNFALLTNGEKHPDSTVWQALPLFFNLTTEADVRATLQDFARSAMCTDWGIRGVSKHSQYYDPISYNNGSVWPFTTGYAATAEYLHHRACNGWLNLMANARMTWLNALGWQTELLSGEYYCPISASVPHQLFSATGIVLPVMTGLLGLDANAQRKTLSFTPHLPVEWSDVNVQNCRCADSCFELDYSKKPDGISLRIKHNGPGLFQFKFSPALGLASRVRAVQVNGIDHPFTLDATRYDVHCSIECELREELHIAIQAHPGIEFNLPLRAPEPGDSTSGLRLIDYELSNSVLKIIFEGKAGQTYEVPFQSGLEIKEAVGAEMVAQVGQRFNLKIAFDDAPMNPYLERTVQVTLG
ncbi:MAG: amylo-alpha-1,6-glucosidase [Candidatus Zhuqueibacterota bacterium]